ncbi:hypothetical protein [Actinoplanes sp. HUAS TT8]|uniref:hypothetical protein n=1 Tax=Actinoplanes sp. HUAS TT8 TaxID=3447453 RepID=UPI003F526605
MNVNYRLLVSTLCAVGLPVMAASPAFASGPAHIARLTIDNQSQCDLIGDGYSYGTASTWVDEPTENISAGDSGEGIISTSEGALYADAGYRVTCAADTVSGKATFTINDIEGTLEADSSYAVDNASLCVVKAISGDYRSRVFAFTLKHC